MTSASPRVRSMLLVGLAYVAVAVVWAAPVSLAPATSAFDVGDPLHLSWVMAWDAHQIVRHPTALFDANGFYPYAKSLLFSDHLLPEAMMVAPVFWATGNALLAANLAVLLGLALSAFTMFLLLRRACGSSQAAFLGGLAYAFNSLTWHELLRVHVLHLEWWPLALLALDRFLRERRRRDAALLAGALALQGLSCSYYLAYSALLAPLWLGLGYLTAGRRPSGREVLRLLAAAAVAAVPVAWVAHAYTHQAARYAIEKPLQEGADLLSFVEPDPSNLVYGNLGLTPRASELPQFLGFATLGLAVLGGAALFRRGAGRSAGVAGLAAAAVGAAICVGPNIHVGGRYWGHGPYRLLYDWIPLTRAMAGGERAGVLVHLGVAILAGLAIAGLLARLPLRARGLATLVLAVVLVGEHWSPPLPAVAVPSSAAVPKVYPWLARHGTGPIVELPLYPPRQLRKWAAYLYFSTFHWRRLPIGRASFYPPLHDFLAYGLRGFPDESSLSLLDGLGVRTLVVHPHVWTAGERAAALAWLDAEPRLTLVERFDDTPAARFAEFGLGDERVYRLSPGPLPSPPCSPRDEIPRAGWAFHHTGIASPELLRDGDRTTAWETDLPQRPGDRLVVLLPKEETVAAASLAFSYPFGEFPRALEVAVDAPGGGWETLPWDDGPGARWQTLSALRDRPRQASLIVRFPPRPTWRVRLAIGAEQAGDAWPRWSIAELRLYRACDASP